MSNDLHKQIKAVTEEFLQKLGAAPISLAIEQLEEGQFRIALELHEPQIFIGNGGENLEYIQHVLRALVRKRLFGDTPLFVDVDINNYKQSKINYLKNLAESLADDVVLTKTEKHFGPMSAYERRVIHTALALRGDVITESRGEEPERHIVIKPKQIS